jgi:hypothetical protein
VWVLGLKSFREIFDHRKFRHKSCKGVKILLSSADRTPTDTSLAWPDADRLKRRKPPYQLMAAPLETTIQIASIPIGQFVRSPSLGGRTFGRAAGGPKLGRSRSFIRSAACSLTLLLTTLPLCPLPTCASLFFFLFAFYLTSPLLSALLPQYFQ